MSNDVKHFGVLGMHWGHHKSQSSGGGKLVGQPVKTLLGTRTKAVYDKNGNDISSKPFKRIGKKKGQTDKEFDKEFAVDNKPAKIVGKQVKTLRGMRTEPVYDKHGNDISSKPFTRVGKKKGQTDKQFDDEMNADMKSYTDAQKARTKDILNRAAANRAAAESLAKHSYAFSQMRFVDMKLGGNPDSSPQAVIARNFVGQAALTVVGIALINKYVFGD